MAHRRNVPRPDRPRLRVSDWRTLGLYRYDAKGRRQDTRIQPYYHKPRKRRVRGKLAELRREQSILATALGVRKDVRERAEAEAYLASAVQGDLSPVRARQLQDGFAKAGMAHLLA